jgi:hypothetical protein
MGSHLKKVILAIDQPGWAFDNIAKQIVKHLGHAYDFQVLPHEHLVSHGGECDVLLLFWWTIFKDAARQVKAAKKYIALYDHWSWPFRPEELKKAVDWADGIWFANHRLAHAIQNLIDTDKPTWVLSDGVDHDLFPLLSHPMTFRAGWTGNSNTGPADWKGLKLIKEACDKAEVDLMVQDRKHDSLIPQGEMAERFYKEINVYINASRAEGTPNPVLEAAACGRPVITTDVGITDKLIIDGVNGFIVPRNVDSMADALIWMKKNCDVVAMGKWARIASLKHTWEKRATAFRHMIEGNRKN